MTNYEVWLADSPGSTKVRIDIITADSPASAWTIAKGLYPDSLIRGITETDKPKPEPQGSA